MTYELLSLLLEYLLAAAPEKDAWDIAEAVGSIVTAISAFAVAVVAIAGLYTWRTQLQYERRLNIASDIVKGLHDVRMGFLGMKGLTKDSLLRSFEDSNRTDMLWKMANERLKPISNRVVEIRGLVVQAVILGMPEFEELMESLFPISDNYIAVFHSVCALRMSTTPPPARKVAEKLIDESGYFEIRDIREQDPLDKEMEELEDKARDYSVARLKTKAWYKQLKFWKTKKSA